MTIVTFTSASSRQKLSGVLGDGNTVANYQPGVGVTGTLTATAWANQRGAAGALDGTGHAPIYLPFTGAKYAYLPAVASNDLTTPNAAANRITGDISIACYFSPRGIWPSSTATILAKWAGAGNNDWVFGFNSGAKQLNFISTADGSTNRSALSSAGVAFSDSTAGYVGVTREAASGDVKFYTSTDGIAWAQLGTTQATTAGAIHGGNGTVHSGTLDGTAWKDLGGYLYWVKLFNAVDATFSTAPVQVFNASDWTETSTNGATQASSTTGEVWTLNNTAIATPAALIASPFIVSDGVAAYIRATYTANQPRTLYIVGMDPVWNIGTYIADGVTANTLGLSKTTATPKISMNAGAAGADDANFTLRAKHVLTLVLNGASSTIQVDSNAATACSIGAGNPGGLTLGADGGTPTVGTFSGFWFTEIIDRNGDDSAGTQTQIQGLLKAIYGTP